MLVRYKRLKITVALWPSVACAFHEYFQHTFSMGYRWPCDSSGFSFQFSPLLTSPETLRTPQDLAYYSISPDSQAEGVSQVHMILQYTFHASGTGIP